ncbi:MAG: DNA-directed RNA polymerase subunit P [Candidatus Aenigmarchaeota archaeon]|nr:DNA-directed RNA polymerase subunit P [Candidatus Aenigmarchaeota archaeon]
MSVYKCVICGKEVDITLSTAKKIQCAFCGKRIIFKPRPSVAKTVKAI